MRSEDAKEFNSIASSTNISILWNKISILCIKSGISRCSKECSYSIHDTYNNSNLQGTKDKIGWTPKYVCVLKKGFCRNQQIQDFSHLYKWWWDRKTQSFMQWQSVATSFAFTDEGKLEHYLGGEFEYKDQNTLVLGQLRGYTTCTKNSQNVWGWLTAIQKLHHWILILILVSYIVLLRWIQIYRASSWGGCKDEVFKSNSVWSSSHDYNADK